VTIKVWKAMSRFDRSQSFKGWVHTITVNHMVDAHRRVDAEEVQMPDDFEPSPTDVNPSHRDYSALPPNIHRIANSLAIGHSVEEIAEKMKVHPRTLKRKIAGVVHFGMQSA
jgi:DNA-directed RNA polymerase specialized sigma24 family protein